MIYIDLCWKDIAYIVFFVLFLVFMIIVFIIVIHSAHFVVVEDLRVFESYICGLKGK